MLIEKLDHYGRGITYIDNKITFVNNALPKEEVEVEIDNEKKKFNEAKVKRYLKYSDLREEPFCPYFGECGGCDLCHINYDEQLKFKLNKVNEIIKKFGDINYEIKDITKTNKKFYRNKATFHVNEKIGYYKEKTNEIIPIDKCRIVNDKINNLLNQLKLMNLNNIYEVVIRVSDYNNESMVILKTNSFIDIDISKLDCDNIIIYRKGYCKVLKGKGYIIEKLDDLKFIISPDSFFQVNTDGASKLYNKVLEFSQLKKEDKVLDLFCGTGTIGLYLSNYCESVIGVEINKSAVNDAIKNKKLNHIKNIDFICDDVSNVNIKNIDVVVVDPPRSGLNKKMIEYLTNLDSRKIVYVSCDPITLARDLKMLKEKYNIKKIELVDMFPWTYHCETICVLERK